MINAVWAVMLAVGIFIGLVNGRADVVTKAAIDGASQAVVISFGLIGAYGLWLGIMEIAQRARLIDALSHIMRPVLHILFPHVPKEHPAMGAISMNMIANILGMGNAATPLGIKAMQHLQQLNPHKETISDDMAMLVVVNAASLQLIPTTVIAMRSSAGSSDPAGIIGTTLITTFCAAVIGICAAKMLEKAIY